MATNLLHASKIIISCTNFNICIAYSKRRIKAWIIIIYGLLMTTNIWTLNNTTLNEGDNSVKLVYLAMVTIHMEVFVHGHDPHCLLCTLSIKIKCQFSINQTNKSTHNKFSLFKDMPLSFPELCCVNPVKRFGSSAESCCGFFFFSNKDIIHFIKFKENQIYFTYHMLIKILCQILYRMWSTCIS